jgi:outer membrane PBP1 activator LpoA protein
MTIQDLRYSLSISLMSSCLLLQGCSLYSNALTTDYSSSRKPTNLQGQSGRIDPAKALPTVELANQLFKQGRKQEAAATYYRAALSLPPPQRERVLLQAAEVTASLGDKRNTHYYLQQIPRQALVGENQARYRYTLALLALQTEQPDQALHLLPLQAPEMTAGLRNKVLLVRQRALEMGGRLPNEYQIAQGIPPELQAEAQQTPQTQSSIVPQVVEHLAVLLPDQGALGAVSQEISQGIREMSRQFGTVTTSKNYPTTQANILAQYQQAASEGADLIIGPLDKEALEVLLANSSVLTVPVLSLNYASAGQTAPALYQFGLSPEDEARQIALVASQRGLRQALVLVPDSQWGSRLAEAFSRAYQAAGGQVMHQLAYPNNSTKNYLSALQAALANSKDAQMIFLGASPTQARLMKPLIQAQAPDLPVYATSHIFSGRLAKNKDIDLDGIIYTEIPFVLQSLQQGSLDQLKYPRLYALGMDAVAVAKNLPSLTHNQRLQGHTGEISLATNRMIQRRLTMATFKDGLPIPLEE